MTVETNTRPSDDISSDWHLSARRQGERGEGPEPRPAEPADSELMFPPIAPRPMWPRVFPGL